MPQNMAQGVAQNAAQGARPGPSTDPARDDRPRSLGTAALHGLGFLILVALMTVLIVVQQRASGAYMAEFSAKGPEEAGHVVTGLMIADYLGAGLPAPLAFIADYGLHYPRVVLGLQPPFYYVLEGLWLHQLAPSTPAVLLLPALLAALLVVSAGWATAQRIGVLPGVAVGAVLMVLPALREATLVVGLDLLLAVLMLRAALAYAAFLDHERLRDGLLFGLLAAAAILTKVTGIALVLLPFLAVVATGRLRLLRRRAFWLPLVLIAVLAGPWTLGTLPMVRAALADGVLSPVAVAPLAIVGALGFVLTALATAGACFVALDLRREAAPRLPLVLLLLAVIFAGTLALLPQEGEAPWLPLLAPLVMLAAVGGLRLIGLVTSGWRTLAGLAVALVMLLAAFPALLVPVTKPALGLDAVAQTFLADTSRPPALLVVADRDGEGALIAAVAQRDRARRSFVVPARAALAVPQPGPAQGGLLYPTPEDLLVGLDGMGVGYLAITGGAPGADGSVRGVVEAALAVHPERFRLLGRFSRPDGGDAARLFAILEASAPAQPETAPAPSSAATPAP